MKKTILLLSVCLVSLFVITGCSIATKKDKVLRHVVLFGFKPEVTAEQIQTVETAFSKLPTQIDFIQDYEWGTDCSPEGKQQGQTHCFLLTFDSEADRDAYLIHPAHKEFGKVLGNKVAAVTVIDYWTK